MPWPLPRTAHLHLLVLPSLTLVLVVFIYPLVRFLSLSLFDPTLTWSHYEKMFTVPVYLRILWTTLRISFAVTLMTFVLGYPVAFLLATTKSSKAALLLPLVVVPFWTSLLVRTYAWMVLLGRRGVVNELLIWMGLISQPLALIYNRLGVYIGMIHILLPFMILPLYAVMRRIDLTLLRAAQNLGAGPVRAFWRVFFPLSLPGVVAGNVLVFIIALGFFVTPALIGGREDQMIAMLIADQISTYLDWGFAAALAVSLLAAAFLLLGLYRFVLLAWRGWARLAWFGRP